MIKKELSPATVYTYEGKDKARVYIFIDNGVQKALLSKAEVINYLESRPLDNIPEKISYFLHHKAGGYAIHHHPGKHPQTGEQVENIFLKQYVIM